MTPRHGLSLIRGAGYEEILRGEAFRRAHPGSEFPDGPVGGKWLAWVPFGSGGVQFSGGDLGELLDEAEAFFREAAGEAAKDSPPGGGNSRCGLPGGDQPPGGGLTAVRDG